MAGLNISLDVLPGYFRFQKVSRAAEQAAFISGYIEVSENLVTYLLRCAEGH